VLGSVPDVPTQEVPYVNGNRLLWTEPEAFQLAASQIEIVCFDSTLTLVKFRDESIARQFLETFPDGQILRNPTVE